MEGETAEQTLKITPKMLLILFATSFVAGISAIHFSRSVNRDSIVSAGLFGFAVPILNSVSTMAVIEATTRKERILVSTTQALSLSLAAIIDIYLRGN